MVVVEIRDEASFASALLAAKGKLVVVDFFATWCGPCKVVAPLFDGWSSKYEKECVFLKVDVDAVREVAQEAGVKQLPSFGFYHQGKMLEMIVGGDPRLIENKIKTLAEKHSTFAFKGAGNSLTGASSAPAGAARPGPAAAAKPTAPGAAPARRNPWADPDFKLAKAAAAPAKPAGAPAATASKPAATPAPVAAAAAKPTPAAATTATAASSAGDRVNPWATKEVSKAPASTPAAAAPKPAPAAVALPVPAASASSAPAVASDTTAASTPVASSSSTTATATAPGSNDPSLTKQLNPTFLSALLEMGFGQVRAEKALILTGNKGIDQGLNWIMQHENDADVDEPLQVVGTAAKTPAGVNLDDMDDDERAIYESVQAKKRSSQGVAFSGGANIGPAKVSTLDMTSEEKMAWLAAKRAEVKARKEVEAVELMKEKERNRKNTVKSAQALDDLKEAQLRKGVDDAIRAKKKEEEEKKKARANILAKLEEDKVRRREQAKREMEAIQAQKAAAAAAAAKK